MRMEIETAMAALKRLLNTPITKTVIVSDSQSRLRKVLKKNKAQQPIINVEKKIKGRKKTVAIFGHVTGEDGHMRWQLEMFVNREIVEDIKNLLYGKQDVDLAVCILSARNNFNYRDAIRRSWLKDFEPHHKKKSAVAKFILGNMDCPIHPKDRLDPHECQAWEPKIPEKTTEITAFSMVAREDRVDCQIVHLFYVKVMHDVILRSLGVVEVFPFENLASNESVQIVLYDSVTNDEITSVLFTQEQGIKSNGFLYKPVQELQLPKEAVLTINEYSCSCIPQFQEQLGF